MNLRADVSGLFGLDQRLRPRRAKRKKKKKSGGLFYARTKCLWHPFNWSSVCARGPDRVPLKLWKAAIPTCVAGIDGGGGETSFRGEKKKKKFSEAVIRLIVDQKKKKKKTAATINKSSDFQRRAGCCGFMLHSDDSTNK